MSHCEASKLRLYVAKRRGTWLKEDRIEHDVNGTLGLQQLESEAAPLRLSGLSERDVGTQVVEEDGAGRNRELQVLVSVPPVPLEIGRVTIGVTNRMVLNDPPLVAYWDALRTDTSKVEADTVWALPEGTFFLGDPAQGSHLYIRECFPRLWDICSKTSKGVSIFGNPGIGKTCFGHFILLHLGRRGGTVVYEDADKCVLFSDQGVVEGQTSDFDQVLSQSSTWYISHDDGSTDDYEAKTIVFTSRLRRTTGSQSLSLCMPVWSEEEIMTCRGLMYSNTPAAIVEDCYDRWGGIPRYVLRYAEDSEQQKLLEKATDMVRVWDVIRISTGWNLLPYAGEDIVVDRLYHYQVNDDFTRKGSDFASSYVINKVFETLMTQDREMFMKYLAEDMFPGLSGAGSGDSSRFAAFLS